MAMAVIMSPGAGKSSAMTVLVLARDFDPTVDAVVLTLAERQVPVFRTDLRDFPTWLGLDAELRDGRWSGRLWTREREVRLEDVRSVWYRNPSSYRFMVTLSADERAFAHREATLGLGGMLASLDALWANHPNRCADAVYNRTSGRSPLNAACQWPIPLSPMIRTRRCDSSTSGR